MPEHPVAEIRAKRPPNEKRRPPRIFFEVGEMGGFEEVVKAGFVEESEVAPKIAKTTSKLRWHSPQCSTSKAQARMLVLNTLNTHLASVLYRSPAAFPSSNPSLVNFIFHNFPPFAPRALDMFAC